MAGAVGTTASDIPKNGWLDRWTPLALRPYLRLARLDRPIGTWLLLFPCWWGVALASPGWPSLWLLAAFGLGAIVMRGAGCTYNDIVDRGFDARVARTADRPIPSGAVSVRQAIAFLLLQLLLGLAVLLTFNRPTIILGVLSLLLVFTYPLMKRITWWPQFFLGLAFNWGALMGYSAVNFGLGLPAILLYAAGIAWTLGYDTIYAHQDKADDMLVGIKSSALFLKQATRPALFGFYLAAVMLLSAAGIAAGLAWPYWALLTVGAAQLAWQALTVDLDQPPDCLVKFKSNRLFGWLVLAGVIVGRLAATA